MISGAKLDVIWSPVHTDKFILWGSDITSYEVAPLKDIENKSTCVKISSSHGATVTAAASAGGVRCVDASWLPGAGQPLLALGHTSGRVTLACLGQSADPLGLSGREFAPRYPRLCNSVAWSPVEAHMLAAAMDKHRSDHCIVLWDVNRAVSPINPTTPTTPTVPDASTSAQSTEQPKPLAEMGLSETAHSVTWTHANRTLIASMNMRYIKIFDLRELSNKAVSMAATRHCYGACADPAQPWQLASRGDSALCVWDARMFQQPLLTMHQPRPVVKILWSPTRRNLLCSLLRDASSLRLHDIQQAHNASKGSQSGDNSMSATSTGVEAEGEAGAAGARGGPAVLERDVSPGGTPLAGFSWHPAHPARVLAVALSGQLLDYTVCERVTVGWGARGGLVWAAGGGTLRTLPEGLYSHLADISHVIKRRAQTDYGLKPDLWQNAELAGDEQLAVLWNFLALSRSLVEDGCIRNSGWRHPGVLAAAGEPAAGYRSEVLPSLLPDLPHRRITVYKSAERTRALQLCGWGWGWEQAGAGVERAEEQGQWARAAALAAFHLRLRAALDVLQRAPVPALRVAALALAGLGDERLWRDALPAAAAALPDPYLRALLHFLAATAPASAAAPAPHHAPQLDLVLNETEMRLDDRVAFACIFLSDARLHDYLRALAATLVEQGALSGILLTGMSPAGVALLQRWLEGSGDVQSAALLAARCLPPDLLRDPRVLHWLSSYRALLDGWKLWWARCSLDTWVSAGGGGGAEGAARQVCVACGYCGKSVAAAAGAPRARPPAHPAARLPPPAAKMKISSCPNCRKPLPRCAVCLLHLGTAAGGGGAGGGAGASFAGWFTWCVACRHGGHATHLLSWFKEHAECPVSSCSCRCGSLDPPDRL